LGVGGAYYEYADGLPVALYVELEVLVMSDGSMVADHVSKLLFEQLELRDTFVYAVLQLHEVRASAFLACVGDSFAIAPGTFEARLGLSTVGLVLLIGALGWLVVGRLSTEDLGAKGA